MMKKKKNINIAIVGLGNIGLYLYKYLKKNQSLLKKKTNSNPMIFGITFKGMPETIDIRNSPSVILANKLIKNNYKIKFYDVMYKELKKIKFEYSKYLTNNKNFINKSDIIILANYHTDYPKIIQPNLKFNDSKNNKLIFDCWNLLDYQSIQNLNWIYKNI